MKMNSEFDYRLNPCVCTTYTEYQRLGEKFFDLEMNDIFVIVI